MSRNDSHNQSFESSSGASPWNLPILALVIGINKYTSPKFSCLQGAVADADAFEDFLRERLNVADENIISLRDEQASRASILSSFNSLKDNAKYKKDEAAIIIYFAGHGGQIEKPEKWRDWVTSTGNIEILCPSDIGCRFITTVNGEECEDVVRGIPDRTISGLLNDISDVKGNNITLILDCCYSAGINRGDESEKDLIRQIFDPPPIKDSTDEEIWSEGTRGSNVADGFSGKFHASHVLLAACGRDQVAIESLVLKRGIFTYNLMEVLTKSDLNILTYTSLIHKLRMPLNQTPHCEGQGVYRRLFNGHASGADSSFILTKSESRPGKELSIILEAGAAQGITVGSRMAVHASNLLENAATQNPCLGYLTVTSVNPFTSVLDFELAASDTTRFQIPLLFYCLIESRASKKIALYCEDGNWIETVFPPEIRERSGITIVDDVQSCDLQLTVDGGKVYFDRYNPLVTPHIGSRISHTTGVGDVLAIRDVVKCSLHFYDHLTRNGRDDFRGVWMELNILTEEGTPTGSNLIADEPATIVVDATASFGMTIFNQTDLPFYPYLFYFDPTDLSIIEWYTAPFGAGLARLINVDVPLRPKSMLNISYGDSGIPTWEFTLREGEQKDVGFLKLFLSSRPTDFSSVLQRSPFETCERGMYRVERSVPDEERWATKLVTLIQVEP